MDVGAGALVLLRRGDLLGHQVVVPRVLLRRGELLGRPRGLIRPFIDMFLKFHLSKYSILRITSAISALLYFSFVRLFIRAFL